MQSLAGSIINIISGARDQFIETDEMKLCESPIERDMIAAFKAIEGVRVELMIGMPELIDLAKRCDHLIVSPQVVVGRYRADFVLAKNHGGYVRLLDVECDGHAFHRATQDQIKRDLIRDQYFNELGIQVFRIRGRNIYRDHFRSAKAAIEQIAPGFTKTSISSGGE